MKRVGEVVFVVCILLFVASVRMAKASYDECDERSPAFQASCQQSVNDNPQAFCGSYCEASAGSICDSECEQKVSANPFQYCAPYSAQFCDPYVETVCGDARQVCEGDNFRLNLGITLGEVHAACNLTNQTALSTAQSCATVNTLTCPPAPQCPNIEPACAKWTRRYAKNGRFLSETCRRWVVPVKGFPNG